MHNNNEKCYCFTATEIFMHNYKLEKNGFPKLWNMHGFKNGGNKNFEFSMCEIYSKIS